jgi:hypothetical protein
MPSPVQHLPYLATQDSPTNVWPGRSLLGGFEIGRTEEKRMSGHRQRVFGRHRPMLCPGSSYKAAKYSGIKYPQAAMASATISSFVPLQVRPVDIRRIHLFRHAHAHGQAETIGYRSIGAPIPRHYPQGARYRMYATPASVQLFSAQLRHEKVGTGSTKNTTNHMTTRKHENKLRGAQNQASPASMVAPQIRSTESSRASAC